MTPSISHAPCNEPHPCLNLSPLRLRPVTDADVPIFFAHMQDAVWSCRCRHNAGSIRMMEKCGFRLVGREQGFANARGATIDEVVLCLD